MYDVITVGSATVDVFARTAYSELVKIIDTKGETDLLAYPCGSKILIEELDFTAGGGGTNTAVTFSRLGLKTAYIGKLGRGTNSDFIHKSLRADKIELLCAHGEGNAGYSIILDNLEHDRTILAYKGINDQLRLKDVPLRKIKAKWLYFCAMMNESFNTLESLAKFAESKKIKIAFNPSSYLAEKGSLHLKRILDRTEVLILNKEEAHLLVGQGPPEDVLPKLRNLGPKIAAVTDGKNEIYAADSGFIYACRPPKVKTVDTTGAGDSFGASFVAGIIRGKNTEFAIKLGVANACSNLSEYGAKTGLLSYNEALRYIRKYKIKVRKKKQD